MQTVFLLGVGQSSARSQRCCNCQEIRFISVITLLLVAETILVKVILNRLIPAIVGSEQPGLQLTHVCRETNPTKVQGAEHGSNHHLYRSLDAVGR